MKSLISRTLFSISLLFSGLTQADLQDVTRIFHQKPTLAQFEICQGGGCYQINKTSLSDAEWRPVTRLFRTQATNAEAERGQIAMAIGLLEEIVGKKVGTSGDMAGTFYSGARNGQQDCNDEAINTTTYMRLLKQAGFIKFHQIEDLHTRNFFFNGWPHTTAVISETATGNLFAVDSWFFDNGHPATIVPLAQWKDNYKPEDSPVGRVRNKQN